MFENYEPLKPHIEHVGPGWIRAFVLDEPFEIGEALAIIGPENQRIFAEVRRHTGNRRVEALILSPPAWLKPGLPIERTHKPCAVEFPTSGDLHVLPETLQPSTPGQNTPLHISKPSFAELDGTRPPLIIQIDALDLLAPITERGLNLVIDLSTNPTAFHTLTTHTRNAKPTANFDATILVPGPDYNAQPNTESTTSNTHHVISNDQPQALRLAAAWAVKCRNEHKNVLLIADLPTLDGKNLHDYATTPDDSSAPLLSLGEIIDLLGQTLTSTQTAAITVLLHLHLIDTLGLEDIIETMHLGDVDTQIFITPDGRFDPRRSLSRAQLSATQSNAQEHALTTLSHAAAAQDRADLFGFDELDEHEQNALHHLETWTTHLR